MCEPQTVKQERSPSHDSGVNLCRRGRCLPLQQGNAARPSQCRISVLCVAAHVRSQFAGNMFVDSNTATIGMVCASPAGGFGRLGAWIVGVQPSDLLQTIDDTVKILDALSDSLPSRQQAIKFGL